MDWLALIHGTSAGSAQPLVSPGDEVRVWYRILEQGKERLGQFEGIVIRYRGAGSSKTFTVRRVTHGEGVERVFPVDSKTISRIEVLKRNIVRRSRLYFLRRVIGKTRLASEEAHPTSKTQAQTLPKAGLPADAGAVTDKPEGALSAAHDPSSRISPHA